MMMYFIITHFMKFYLIFSVRRDYSLHIRFPYNPFDLFGIKDGKIFNTVAAKVATEDEIPRLQCKYTILFIFILNCIYSYVPYLCLSFTCLSNLGRALLENPSAADGFEHESKQFRGCIKNSYGQNICKNVWSYTTAGKQLYLISSFLKLVIDYLYLF